MSQSIKFWPNALSESIIMASAEENLEEMIFLLNNISGLTTHISRRIFPVD